MPTWFLFEHEGQQIVGPVQGCGGFVSDIGRLQAAQRLASEGREHGLYEPSPGCVHVFPDYCAASNGEPLAVPVSALRGYVPIGCVYCDGRGWVLFGENEQCPCPKCQTHG